MKYSFSRDWFKLHVLESGSEEPVLLSMFRALWRRIDLIGIAVVAFVLVYGRWLSIVFPFPINPDEAQAAANALRIKAYGYNWDALDGSTAGPLDSLILSWPYPFGLDVTLSTTRLTACILLLFICVFVYFSIKLVSGRGIAALFVAPLVIFYSFTEDQNFLHYSSELLPLFFLTAANYFAIRISLNRSGSHELNFVSLGILLGATPFAKLQAAPIAVAIGLYALILAAISSPNRRVRNVVALSCGGLTPAAIILVPLFISGHIQDFWKSYIAWAFLYVKEPISFLAIHWMIASDPVLRYVSYFIWSLGFASLLHASFVPRSETAADRTVRCNVIYSLLLVIVAFWVIAKPGNGYQHYLMFFPPFLLIFCAFIASAFVGKRAQVLSFISYYAVLSVIFVGLFLDNAPIHGDLESLHGKYRTILHQPFTARSPQLLSWLPIPAKHLLVWGWMPQWYVWSNLTPATRETQIYTQVMTSGLTEYFRSRFMSDIKESSPEVIIDAVEGKSFFFKDPSKYSPAVFEPFANLLAQNYSQLPAMEQDPDCPKIYVKNEYKKLIDDRLIFPTSVVATDTLDGDRSAFNSAKLFDNSVTEDTCIDYWLLPPGRLGGVSVGFSKAERVSELMLLNTQDSSRSDRSTRDIEVRFLASGVVVEKRQITMKSYPYWTVINFDGPVKADHLEVDVLSYYGRGGGLNEIKIFRANEVGESHGQ